MKRLAYGFVIACAVLPALAPSCASEDGDDDAADLDGGARGGTGGSSAAGGASVAGRGGGSAGAGASAGAAGSSAGSGGGGGSTGGSAGASSGGSGGSAGAGSGGAAGGGGASTNGDESVFHFEGTTQGWTAVRGPQTPAPVATMAKSFAGRHALKYEIEVKAEDLAQTDAGATNRERAVGLTLHAQTIPLNQTEPFWSGKKVKLRIWFDEKPPTDFVVLFAQASDREWVSGPPVSLKAGDWTVAELDAPAYSYPAPAQRGFAYYMTFGVYLNFVSPWKGIMYVDAVEAM